MEPEKGSSSSGQKPSWLAVFLGILGSFLVLSRFSQLDTPMREDNKNPTEKRDDTEEKYRDRSPTSAFIHNVPQNPINTDKCKHKPAPLWEKLLAGIGVLAAVVYAGVSLKMWHEMRKQTRVLAQTEMNADRAWVGLDGPIVLDSITPMGPNVTIRGHYTIENFGHGPAVKVMHSADFLGPGEGLEIQGREAKFSCDSSIAFTTGTVPVGGTMKQPPPFGYTLFPNQPHNESIEYQGPVDTLRFLQFVGCVAYIDQFKTVHWTRFCMWRKPGDTTAIPKLEFCSLYNDTGDGPPR